MENLKLTTEEGSVSMDKKYVNSPITGCLKIPYIMKGYRQNKTALVRWKFGPRLLGLLYCFNYLLNREQFAYRCLA